MREGREARQKPRNTESWVKAVCHRANEQDRIQSPVEQGEARDVVPLVHQLEGGKIDFRIVLAFSVCYKMLLWLQISGSCSPQKK